MKVLKVSLINQMQVLCVRGKMETTAMVQPQPGRTLRWVAGYGVVIELDNAPEGEDFEPQLIPVTNIRYVRFPRGEL